MTHAQALAVLGVVFEGDTQIDAAFIARAYAGAVKDAHPDTGAGHRHSIAELQQARDLLLDALKTQKCACKLCRGVGQVRGAMGMRRCGACGGTGETR